MKTNEPILTVTGLTEVARFTNCPKLNRAVRNARRWHGIRAVRNRRRRYWLNSARQIARNLLH